MFSPPHLIHFLVFLECLRFPEHFRCFRCQTGLLCLGEKKYFKAILHSARQLLLGISDNDFRHDK